jgi:copper chaperone CopZ
MKIKQIILIIIAVTFSISVNAQKEKTEKNSKTEIIEIQTSAQCEMCKETIEKEMAFVKGVKYVNLDLETKKVTVKFRKDKTDSDKIKHEISELGYDADEVTANPKVYEKLPACCKKEE